MPTEYFLAHMWLIPLFPLAGAVLMFFLGRRLSRAAVYAICVGSMFVSTCYAFGAIWQLMARPSAARLVNFNLFTWIPAGMIRTHAGGMMNFSVPWGVRMDPLTALMLAVPTAFGFLAHVYSARAKARVGGDYRFFGYLNLFMFSTFTLVLANNLLLLFVGWVGVGLCSYLLVGFHDVRKAAAAGNQAFPVNRMGVDSGGWLVRMVSRPLMAVDSGVVDGLVNLVAGIAHVLSFPVRMLQTGRISRYALFMLIGVVIFLGYFLHAAGLPLTNRLP